jgi:hypothetical protein
MFSYEAIDTLVILSCPKWIENFMICSLLQIIKAGGGAMAEVA